jgi:hypothetical protein
MRNIVAFHVKGRPYALKFGSKNLYDLTKRGGKSVIELMQDPFGGWPDLLMAGLQKDHPDLNMNNVSRLIDEFVSEKDYSEMGKLLRQGLEEAGFLPKDEDDEPADASAEGKATSPDPLRAA